MDIYKRLNLKILTVIFLLISFGFLSVYFSLIDMEFPAQMIDKNTTYDLTFYSTSIFPNVFYSLFFIIIFLIPYLFLNKKLPDADPMIFFLVTFLSGISLILLYRLSPEIALVQNKPLLRDLAIKQFFWVGIGLSSMLVLVSLLKEQHFTHFSRKKYIYVLLSFVLIIITSIFGKEVAGRRLWIPLGHLSIQTVEIVKVILIFFIAGYFRDEGKYIQTTKFLGVRFPQLKYTGPFFVMWFLAILPVFLQRDLGPTILLFCLFLTMFYIGSGLVSFVVIGILMIVASGFITYYLGFPSMVKTRIDMWLHPFSYGEGVVQSFWAIASGNLWGAGLGYGQAHYIPVVQSDFNFSAICEELGFIGGASLLLIYGLLLYRGFKVAVKVDDVYRKLIITGIMTMLSLQALMIICGNMGLLPMTGITLPFVSYGGSSMIINFLTIGVVLWASNKDSKE